MVGSPPIVADTCEYNGLRAIQKGTNKMKDDQRVLKGILPRASNLLISRAVLRRYHRIARKTTPIIATAIVK